MNYPTIPVFVEQHYVGTKWGKQVLQGMYMEAVKHKYNPVIIDDKYEPSDHQVLFGAHKIAIIIGTQAEWVYSTAKELVQNNIHPVVVCYQYQGRKISASYVHMNYALGMNDMLEYLYSCGRDRIALYGIGCSSASDIAKKEAFLSMGFSERDIFPNSSFDELLQKVNYYNAVICTNDLVSISLLYRLKEFGIKVPEQLYLVTYGEYEITKYVTPAITTIKLDHEELGKQAIRCYHYLKKQISSIEITMSIKCSIIPRASTENKPLPIANDIQYVSKSTFSTPAEDAESKNIFNLENMISCGDSIDFSIVLGLMSRKTVETIAEELSMADTSIRYRIRKMINRSGFASTKDMLECIKKYISTNNIVKLIQQSK